ncbi:MAG: ABC transporter ATP-binding protein [Microcystis panniformis]|jgi:ABC-type multidrug transport system fused ATPase/permease subunit|nr:ATP-binding cassette domain-containing protein [Microcystis aeruginosa F13-15]
MISYLSKVWYILKGSRKCLPFLIFIFLFSSILEVLGISLIAPFFNLASNPDYINRIPFLDWIYNKFGFQSSGQFIALLGLVIAIVYCFRSLLYFLSQIYIVNFSFDQTKNKLSLKLLQSYLAVPYTFHLERNSASLTKNIIIETQNFLIYCLMPLLNSIANLIILLLLVLLLAKINIFFLVLLLGMILPIFLVFYQLKNRFRRWGQEASESYQEMIRIINHSLGGIKETRIIGCESYFLQQMQQQTQRYVRTTVLCITFEKLPRILTEAILVLLVMLFISISQLFLKQNFSEIISTLAVFAVASIRLIPAASQLIGTMGQLQYGAYTVQMLYSDLKEVEKQGATQSLKFAPDFTTTRFAYANAIKAPVMSFNNRVDLKDLTYRYPNISEPALNNISLSLKKGESIALIGKSGAGKTTLVDVILGFLIPESGDIQVDGVSIYQDIRSWQNLIGYIPQSIFLTDDTIERNIAFGVPDSLIDKERLQQAISSAQLTELVEQLPNGIKTEVGERGVRLSGGQRQRVGIARALYHEREILVLDEATSALDNETEKLVSQSIQALSGMKTLIVIAHRLTTVEYCDRVYLMDRGIITKSGSYKEVVFE